MQIDFPALASTTDRVAAPSARLPIVTNRTALFLDFDGTLADIAPQPDQVEVPVGLVLTLSQVAARLNGALAIVSGRTLLDLDAFLTPLRLPAAAEHGAAQRLADGQVLRLASPDFHEISRVALALAAQHDGLRIEIKQAALALHYRQAPALGQLCLQAMAEAVKRTPGVDLLQGKCVIEIKAAGVSKGTAIAAFMAQAPFAGRVPVFAGDDTTDEAGFASVQALGGQGIKIGEGHSLATYRCASPALLLQWLQTAFEVACA